MNAPAPERRQTGIEVMVDEIGKRLDKQDVMLLTIHTTITQHIAEERGLKPSLDELVSLWKGSKVISAILATLCGAGAILYAVFIWARDHIK